MTVLIWEIGLSSKAQFLTLFTDFTYRGATQLETHVINMSWLKSTTAHHLKPALGPIKKDIRQPAHVWPQHWPPITSYWPLGPTTFIV